MIDHKLGCSSDILVVAEMGSCDVITAMADAVCVVAVFQNFRRVNVGHWLILFWVTKQLSNVSFHSQIHRSRTHHNTAHKVADVRVEDCCCVVYKLCTLRVAAQHEVGIWAVAICLLSKLCHEQTAVRITADQETSDICWIVDLPRVRMLSAHIATALTPWNAIWSAEVAFTNACAKYGPVIVPMLPVSKVPRAKITVMALQGVPSTS